VSVSWCSSSRATPTFFGRRSSTAFFSDPELQQFIGDVGASGGQPDVTFSEAVSSPDEF
jgi:hypothetical protein